MACKALSPAVNEPYTAVQAVDHLTMMKPAGEHARVTSRVFTPESIVGGMELRERAGGSWTLLTGHGHGLVEIARNTRVRIRDIAVAVGLAERTVQVIIADLEAADYLTRARAGWRTVYTVHLDRPFRRPAQDGLRIGPFLELLAASGDQAGDAAAS